MEPYASSPTKPSTLEVEGNKPAPSPLRKIIAVASIAAGIQFGWALQLSLLTPYVQLLGVPHTWAAFIWLCGPISGMVVQPIVGYYSDRCTSRFGRRRPFIFSGAVAVAVAVFLIGYAADLGYSFGDDITKKTRPRAVAIFVIGFWILDVANNMLQGPCRAFLGDLSAGDPRKIRTANAFFSFFMAVGNVLGYAAGSYSGLHKIFPFSDTKACDIYCANLKSCFFFSIALLLIVSAIALSYVKDEPLERQENGNGETEETTSSSSMACCFGSICGALKQLKKPMWMLLLVTALNWVAWFPFLLYDTDWMGREVYGGKVGDAAYDRGVRAGSLGLMLNSVVLGVASLGVEHSARLVGGAHRLWGIVNFFLAVCLAMTVVVTKAAESHRQFTVGADGTQLALPPPTGVKVGSLVLFSAIGIPLAINFSVPFALASIFSSTTGAGQGLSLGVLNLAIVIPQMFVSVTSGPWDALFGGGNLPGFAAAAVAAAISGLLAIILLNPPKDLPRATSLTGGLH